VKEGQEAPIRTERLITRTGWDGQRLFLMPAPDFVVAMNAGNYHKPRLEQRRIAYAMLTVSCCLRLVDDQRLVDLAPRAVATPCTAPSALAFMSRHQSSPSAPRRPSHCPSMGRRNIPPTTVMVRMIATIAWRS